MIRVVQARDVCLKSATTEQSHDDPDKVLVCDTPSQREQGPAPPEQNDPKVLFPSYYWDSDLQFEGTKFFNAAVPDNWRRFSGAGEWVFGLTLFESLHWYWSSLKWPDASVGNHSVSWLELALDFFACALCALSMPDQDTRGNTAFTVARFFEQASIRMGKMCKQTPYPGQRFWGTQIVSLHWGLAELRALDADRNCCSHNLCIKFCLILPLSILKGTYQRGKR